MNGESFDTPRRDDGADSTPIPPAKERPDRLGRFQIVGELGQGGMGTVFEAYDETLDRKVAVKQLYGEAATEHQQRLLREAQALARLSHPNVVQVHDAGVAAGGLFIAMELVSGQTLRAWQQQPKDWRTCVDVYTQAGCGLAAAHAAGIVHRDFKPANCIVDARGRVKVLDFGLARGHGDDDGDEQRQATLGPTAPDDDDGVPAPSNPALAVLARQLTQTGAVMGTPAYMAPEQTRQRPVDARADQFSFCVSLYEAIHGVRPFDGMAGMIRMFEGETPSFTPSPSHVAQPKTPKWLRMMLTQGLAVDPKDRFETMDALLALIEDRLQRRRRGRLGGLVLSAGLVLAWGTSATLGDTPCEGLRDSAMAAWTPERRESVELALLATTMEFAEPAWASVSRGLDSYSEQWVEARAQACEATHVEHAASEELLELRLGCLDRRALHVHAVVEQLLTADAGVVAHAGQAVRSLPPVEVCADTELLRGEALELPEHLEPAAKDLRASIADAWAAGAAGRWESGLELGNEAVSEAEALGEDGAQLVAEAKLVRGRLLRSAQRLQEAREDLGAVLERSEEVEDREMTLDALRELATASAAGEDQVSFAAWMPAIRGKLRRLRDRPRFDADLYALEGLLATTEGDHEEAVGSLTVAVELYRSLGSSAVTELSYGLILMGQAHAELEHDDDAQRALGEAMALAQAEALFPMMVMAGDHLAHLHFWNGRYEQAEVVGRRTLELAQHSYGERSAATIAKLLLLADLAEIRGDIPSARDLLQRARASIAPHVPARRRAQVHHQAGHFERGQGELDAALEAYRLARAAWADVPSPQPLQLANLDVNIGDCLMILGEFDSARQTYQQVLATLELHASSEEPLWVFASLGLGHVLVEQGEVERGIHHLRRAWTLGQRHDPQEPSLVAVLQSELGTALLRSEFSKPEHIAEAVGLLESALEYFRSEQDRDSARELETLLEQCGTRCSGTSE